VDHLLTLRERTDLDTVEIKLEYESLYNDDGSLNDDAKPYVNLWIRSAVMCKVRALTLHTVAGFLYLDDLPLVSRHLRTLDLDGVGLKAAFLNFANCSALDNLKMNDCDICAGTISSPSLKNLSITNCGSDLDCRVHVSTPDLVTLELDDFSGRTPFLENMSLLETAYVEFGRYCEDVCVRYDSGVFCGAKGDACDNCAPIKDDCSSDCVILGGISSAKHLKFLSESTNV
jgi:hypothetical protein